MERVFIAVATERGDFHKYIIGSFVTESEADEAMLDEEIKRGGKIIGGVVESTIGVSKNDPYDESRPFAKEIHRTSDRYGKF